MYNFAKLDNSTKDFERGRGYRVNDMALSQDGRYAAVAMNVEGTPNLTYDDLDYYEEFVKTAIFRPHIRIFDINTGKIRKEIRDKDLVDYSPKIIEFSPDSKYFVDLYDYPSYSVRVWDANKWEILKKLEVKSLFGKRESMLEVVGIKFNPQKEEMIIAASVYKKGKLAICNTANFSLTKVIDIDINEELKKYGVDNSISKDDVMIYTNDGKYFILVQKRGS
jgi:WD40 repeat protein